MTSKQKQFGERRGGKSAPSNGMSKPNSGETFAAFFQGSSSGVEKRSHLNGGRRHDVPQSGGSNSRSSDRPAGSLLNYSAASAQHFGGVVSVQRLRRAVARKELRAVKLGHRTVLFRPVDLDKWAESFAVEAMV